MAMLISVRLFSAHAQTAEATRVERVEKFLEKTSPGRGERGFTSYSVAVAGTTILTTGRRSRTRNSRRCGSVPARYVRRKRPALRCTFSIGHR